MMNTMKPACKSFINELNLMQVSYNHNRKIKDNL